MGYVSKDVRLEMCNRHKACQEKLEAIGKTNLVSKLVERAIEYDLGYYVGVPSY